ncbi:zinc-binding dehydrogenase [Agrococcus sp. SGAir0287]|uniref:zinc-binding dehydrogenase n=1 Tax=Agrococcus sp. SGAir0287 TaxID=2070347 RepID=UPI0010CD4C70|nr:zinc-binding dehydrogenase [Agrococcus sp. SGAir0287]QCR20474.1 NADPH:quinone oxidoreductase [Agrococcus sp. SGAir0287]
MRAIVHETFGEPADVLTIGERPTPEPGPGQARVRVLLATIHNHDLWTVRGTYGVRPELPAVAGTEAVGIVDALGEGVDRVAVGDRVVIGGAPGAWAEQVVVDARGLVPAPEGMPDEAAAQLVAMPFSAVSLLHSLHLEPGQWIVQNAANGAVGRMVAQLAVARGIHVVGLVRRTAAIEELREAGIEGIVATDEEGWRDRVAALTGGAPIVAGVDSVGGAAAGEVLSVLGEGGTLVAFGAMGDATMELSSGDLIFKQATVRGFWGAVVSRTMDADTRATLFAELGARIADGSLTLPVSSIHGFDDVTDAVRASLTPGRVGKVLLRP